MSGARSYGSGVRVGNWNEDKYFEEEKTRQFLDKKSSGELSYMKTAGQIASVTSPVSLSSNSDGRLSIGDVVVLQHTVSEQILSSLPIPDGDGMSMDCSGATHEAGPSSMARNTFTVLSADGAQQGTPVRYGDRIVFCNESKWYLFSERPSLGAPVARFSGEQAVTLKLYDSPSACTNGCTWILDAVDAGQRPELLGTPVPASVSVLVRHAASNELLRCLHEQRRKLWSSFGVESEVSCNTGKVGTVMGEYVARPDNEWKIINK